MQSAGTTKHDVIVVGSRCAGASTARLLAARGHDVLMLDRTTLPSDTLSTHGIARGGVVQLSRWGLLEGLLKAGVPPVRQVVLGLDGVETHRTVKENAGVDLLLAPRRTVLDAYLADAAVEAGASLHAGTAVTGLLRDPTGRVTGVTARSGNRERTIGARLVIGADGVRSTTAGLVGARLVSSFDADLALFYTYVVGTSWRGFEFHVTDRAFAGGFPTNDGQACVWITRPTPLLRPLRARGPARLVAFLQQLEQGAPGLAELVRAGRVVAPLRGCLGLPNHIREAYGAGWALVGDAGYHRDPITGHGITDAFRDAELLADSADAYLGGEPDALAGFQAERDRALADTYRLTRELTGFPDPARFVELQIELGEALEREATELASRPAPAGLAAYAA